MYSVNFNHRFWIIFYNLILPICNVDTASNTKIYKLFTLCDFPPSSLISTFPFPFPPLSVSPLYFWLGTLFCPRYFVLHPHSSTLFPILHPISLFLLPHLSLNLHSLSISTLPSHKSSFLCLFFSKSHFLPSFLLFLHPFCSSLPCEVFSFSPYHFVHLKWTRFALPPSFSFFSSSSHLTHLSYT